MDMGMDCDPAVADLPLSDPKCQAAAECCMAFLDAENDSQDKTPWAGQFLYGHYTLWFWLVLLGVFIALHLTAILRSRKRVSATPYSTESPAGSFLLKDKVRAASRFILYRRFDKRPELWAVSIPSTGGLVVLVITVVFLAALVFAERPYYRPSFSYGSPPIAIRTGLMAFACTPILVALAGKANVITLLTGISHEKLNVMHQWAGWITFVLSLIHTIPFFVASLDDPFNGGYTRVVLEFYRNGAAVPLTEYSGVPPLAILFGLCVFSIRPIREWIYETFYFAHIGLAITYLGLLFWHAGPDARDSWIYLWATLVLWALSWAVRLLRVMRSSITRPSWSIGEPSVIKVLPADLIRLEVPCPASFNYRPGQHFFLRVHSVGLLDSHPFTVASTSEGRLLFLAKIRAGFTKRLAEQATESDGADGEKIYRSSVILDGPYGGPPEPGIEKHYDSIVLIAGGFGISYCLSWLTHLCSLTSAHTVKHVTLVWAVRDAVSLNWISNELLQIMSLKDDLNVDVKLFVTGGSDTRTLELCLSDDKTPDTLPCKTEPATRSSSQEDGLPRPTYGRPDIRAIVNESLAPDRRILVMACGPHGMNYDAANACATVQKAVLRGRALELAFHAEVFGW